MILIIIVAITIIVVIIIIRYIRLHVIFVKKKYIYFLII